MLGMITKRTALVDGLVLLRGCLFTLTELKPYQRIHFHPLRYVEVPPGWPQGAVPLYEILDGAMPLDPGDYVEINEDEMERLVNLEQSTEGIERSHEARAELLVSKGAA